MAPFGVYALAKMPPAERRAAIAKHLSAPNPDAYDIGIARQAAVAYGLWDELAAQFPQHFGDRFVLHGPRPAGALPAPAATRAPVTAVSEAALADCVGLETLVRVERHRGETATFVGTIKNVEHDLIVFTRLNAAKAKAMLQPGDRLEMANEQVTSDGRSSSVYLNAGDRIVTAVPVDGPLPAIAKTHVEHRVNLRGRAEAVLRGEYAPRLDLSRAQEHVLREADGTPRLTPDRILFDREFVTAFKTEQNVLAAALCNTLVPRLATAIASYDVKEVHAKDESGVSGLQIQLGDVARRVVYALCSELEGAKTTPLAIAYANLRTLLAFRTEYLQAHFAVQDSVADFFLAGFNTALATILELATVASQLGAADPSKVTAASSPLVLQLAAMPIDPFIALFSGGWEPKDFDLTGDRVVVSKAFHEKTARARGVGLDTVFPGTTGCPAKVAFGSGNPLTALVEAIAAHVGPGAAGPKLRV